MIRNHWMRLLTLLLILFFSLLFVSCSSLQTFTGRDETSQNKEQKKDKNDDDNQKDENNKNDNGTTTKKPVIIEFSAVW